MDPPGEYLAEGPDPGPIEEPAVVEVDPHAAVDGALEIDVDDVRATERDGAIVVEQQLAHIRRFGTATPTCAVRRNKSATTPERSIAL